ncbi:RTA1-domain-containing protein [Mycena metata]|uniref:RTA1-domain-containing protein n=1 Tax=Mycena metata TaxID=1033252 RepID=A0AAD7HV63_9AGAR|nr:RTA1-domain-containing protein [Mycena metata]
MSTFRERGYTFTMSPFAFEPLATISRLTLRDDASTDDNSQYGYKPSEAIAILFVTLYGISTILHIGQATYYRTWWLLPTAALCGIGEVLGWSGRLWSSISLFAQTPFLMQISTTIIAPTPLLAASFMIVARVIQQLGTSYSRLTPKWYTILFLPCDIIALVIQAIGGGMASSANTLSGANVGAHVMLGGIVFQFVVIILFSALTVDFVRRYLHDRPVRVESTARGALTPRLKIMLAALAFSTTTLFIRSVYRIIELSGGWNGRIIHTEVYFNVLDGGMVVLAMFTLNFAHPGLLLRQQAPAKGLVEFASDSFPKESSTRGVF